MATSGLNAGNPREPEPAAIVLVGGRSTRMGTDKAALVLDGVAMRDRVLAAVSAAGITTVIVAGTDDVPDAIPATGPPDAQGPLAGIVGAWRAMQQAPRPNVDPVVVLACDLPWLVADVITAVIGASRDHTHGAVAHDGDRPQPLVAAYRRVALDEMARCYDAGERSLRRCSAQWDLGTVPADPTIIADADTPDDLAGFVVEWPS